MDFFFIAYRHSARETVKKDLEKYLDISQSYIISLETSAKSHVDFSGEHYHFAVERFAQYNNYCKNIIIRKYGLKGKPVPGKHGNQYGKVRKVRDQEKFLQYIVKEADLNNIIFKQIDIKTIQEYIHRSYRKEDRQSFHQQVINHLVIHTHSFHECPPTSNTNILVFSHIEKEVIQYIVDNGAETQMTATKSKIKHLVSQFLLYHYKDTTISYFNEDDHRSYLKAPDKTLSDYRYAYIMRN